MTLQTLHKNGLDTCFLQGFLKHFWTLSNVLGVRHMP
jgi:hypothetical protein